MHSSYWSPLDDRILLILLLLLLFAECVIPHTFNFALPFSLLPLHFGFYSSFHFTQPGRLSSFKCHCISDQRHLDHHWLIVSITGHHKMTAWSGRSCVIDIITNSRCGGCWRAHLLPVVLVMMMMVVVVMLFAWSWWWRCIVVGRGIVVVEFSYFGHGYTKTWWTNADDPSINRSINQ